jgi:hypothetical protein
LPPVSLLRRSCGQSRVLKGDKPVGEALEELQNIVDRG